DQFVPANFLPADTRRLAEIVDSFAIPSREEAEVERVSVEALDQLLLHSERCAEGTLSCDPPFITLDWKDMPGDIIDQAAACLPKKSFTWEFADAAETKLEFRLGERTTKVRFPKWNGESEAPRIHKLLRLVRDFIKPEWDIKILAETSGDDTQTFLISPNFSR
ncbi:MAG TPA: hypothetical protein PK308_10005, partial [Phycisphaerales bacterium]|nr:hypothetical protein [Phycisphaerales bacterium]